MIIENYIANDFPILGIDTTAEEALQTAVDFDFTHVFVENEDVFQGAVRKECLEENLRKNLGELLPYMDRFSILYESTLLDGVKLFHTFNTNVIPVINKNEEYQGYIAWDSIADELSKYPFFSETGALLTVEIPRTNYSMVEIAQIVESNNGKFYGALVTEMNEAFVRVTMRISNENLSSIDETFERYGYIIVQKFYTDEKEELLKSRYEFMQKYLEF